MKKCTKCGIEKPLSEFGKDSHQKSGLKPRCKECIERVRRKKKFEIEQDKRTKGICKTCGNRFYLRRLNYIFCSAYCYRKHYRLKNKSDIKVKKKAAKSIETKLLKDNYIKKALCDRSKILKYKDITPEMVELKRIQIQIKRLIKQIS